MRVHLKTFEGTEVLDTVIDYDQDEEGNPVPIYEMSGVIAEVFETEDGYEADFWLESSNKTITQRWHHTEQSRVPKAVALNAAKTWIEQHSTIEG